MIHNAGHTISIAGWETIGILVIALALLISGKIRIDLIAIFILLTLGIAKLLDEKQLFAGFNSEAVILIVCMFILGEGLVNSGVTDWLSTWISRVAGATEKRLLSLLMIAGGLLSSFLSDLAIVSIFLPVLLSFEKRVKVKASRLLLPFAIASILGGLITMVGSATNIVANQLIEQSGLPKLSLFAIAPLGLALMATGVLFMSLLGPFLLPKNRSAVDEGTQIGIQTYYTELRIPENSAWIDRRIQEIPFFQDYSINIVRILRYYPIDYPKSSTRIRKNDVLLVQIHRDDLLKLSNTPDFIVQSDEQQSMQPSNVSTAGEAIILRSSVFVGRTLKQLRFRERFRVSVLAMWRNGEVITKRLATITLKSGDMLLLQGSRNKIKQISEQEGLLLISKKSYLTNARKKGPLAVAILCLVFFLASRDLLPITLASSLGVALMVLFKIITMNQAYRSIEWKILLFIVAMFALSAAMQKTGVVHLAGQEIIRLFGHYSPYVLLAVCFWCAALTTQVLSNTATTLLLTPIMIQAASSLHYNPIPFVVAVIVGVTASPITYVSHKVFLIIMGPGGYRYWDYIRMGIPLTLLFFSVAMWLVPKLWHF